MQTAIVIACVVVAAGFLGWKLVKQFAKKKEDDCGCGKCG